MSRTLRIASRPSPLALLQAQLVADALLAHEPDHTIEIVPIRSSGDRNQTAPFAQVGERGIFVRELERALLDGEVDAAVHSCKDLALDDTSGLQVAALLPREDARDVVCGTDATTIAELREGATIATSSVRRTAGLRLLRPDLQAVPIRGNVATRLQHSRDRGDDACLLAAAGVHRLGLHDQVSFPLQPQELVPEAGQGAIVVQVRAGEHAPFAHLADPDTMWAVAIERAVAARLDGGCTRPVGVHVQLGGMLDVEPQGYVFVDRSPNGLDLQLTVLESLPILREMSVDDAVRELVRLAGTEVRAT